MDLATILETVLSPHTTPEARRFAHEQLEIYKTRRDALETCLNLFIQEFSTNRREYLLHFALRTSLDIAHAKYANGLSQEEIQLLKNATITILSKYALQVTPLVLGPAISLAVEILKNDVDHAGFFELIVAGLKDSTWSRIACQVLCEFSQLLVNEDEEHIVPARKTKLTKFISVESSRLLLISLDLIQLAFQQQSDPLQLIAALNLANEVLRWAVPSNTQWERVLYLFEACSNGALPVNITCAGLGAFRAFVANKTLDLEKSGVQIPKVYEAIRRAVVLRSVPFRSDQELYAATDVLLTAIEKHHVEIPKVTMVQDLEKFTTSGNPHVLGDVLAIWKDLIATGAIELDDVIVAVIMNQCVVCPRSSGDEEEEEDQRGNTIKEMTKRRPDLVCPCAFTLLSTLVSNSKFHDAWLLMEAISNGISQKHLDMFAVRTATSPPFVSVLENILDMTFNACRSSTSGVTLDKMKLVHSAHRLFEVRPNYLGMALQLFTSVALTTQTPPPTPKGTKASKASSVTELRKRAATFLLGVLRRIASKKTELAFSFLSNAILPALVQQVAQAFPTLTGPERFILLECVLVAGKALPNEVDRVQLTRDVLSEPFQILATLGLEVMNDLLQEIPEGSFKFELPWDERGYFADIEALPEKSKRVSIALMTLSTCSQDGALTNDMWQQLIPFAAEFLSRLDMIWESWQNPGLQWAFVIHPVDARCILGGRLAESMEAFLEGLVEFGEKVLKPQKMSIIAFLSSARSCALELLKAAAAFNPQLITKEHCLRLFRPVETMENRHLAALLSSVPLQAIDCELFDQLMSGHLLARLRQPLSSPCYRVRTYPGCAPELVEDVDDAARCSLELAFCRSLRACDEMTEPRFMALAERLVLGDDPTIRMAASAIHDKCLPRFPGSVLVRVALRACATSYTKKAFSSEASERAIVDLATEVISRVLFQAPAKEFHRVNRGNSGKKKRMGAMQDLNELLGSSKVTAFLDEVYLAKSEKAFKALVTELFQTLASEQRDPSGTSKVGGNDGATTGGAKKGAKKPKKKKKARGLKDVNGDSIRTEEEEEEAERVGRRSGAQGTWHDAANAQDLGMLLLFNGKQDASDDDL